jgi:NitT/TauT family transport system substrate-binding protein
VDPENVTFVAVGGPSTAYLSLSTGQIDAALTWAPAAAICEVLGTCKIAWSQADSPEPKILTLDAGANNLLVSTRPYIVENPHVIEAIKAAAQDAEAWVQDPANFDALVELVKSTFEIKLDNGDQILAQAVRNALPGLHTKFDPEGVRGAAKFAATLKMADRIVEYDEMIAE